MTALDLTPAERKTVERHRCAGERTMLMLTPDTGERVVLYMAADAIHNTPDTWQARRTLTLPPVAA